MNKKLYYAAQESAYKKIQERGEAGWMRKSMEDFRDPETDKIIKTIRQISSLFPKLIRFGDALFNSRTGYRPLSLFFFDF